jgi:hypothetical protein
MMYRPTRESYGRTADLTPQAEALCARIAQEGGAAGVELIEADAEDGIVLVAGLIAAGVPEARLISNAMRVAHAMDAARATDMWQRGSHEAAYARLRKPCESGEERSQPGPPPRWLRPNSTGTASSSPSSTMPASGRSRRST